MATAEMLAAEDIQIQGLQRELAAAQQRIQQLRLGAVILFGEDFKRLAQQEAAEYTTIATKALTKVEKAIGSEPVLQARLFLEAEPTPENAARALEQIGARDVGNKEQEVERLGPKPNELRIDLRNVLAMRIRAEAEPMNEQSFDEILERAFGSIGRSLDTELRAAIKLAYHKICEKKGFADQFPSKAKKSRRSRPRRSKAAGGDGVTSPALDGAPAPRNGLGAEGPVEGGAKAPSPSSGTVAVPAWKTAPQFVTQHAETPHAKAVQALKSTEIGHSRAARSSSGSPRFVQIAPLLAADAPRRDAARPRSSSAPKKKSVSFADDFAYVTDLDEADLHIAQLRADLSCTPIVGVDVEYHGNVICLIQLSSNQRTIVLDAITLHTWMHQLLQPLLHDDKVVKVFHGDIKHTSSLNLVYDIMVNRPIFCVAEEALKLDKECEYGGFRPLRTLTQHYLGYDLPEVHSMGGWQQRPLPPQMVQRAALDARVLIDLHNIISAPMRTKNRACSGA